MVNMLRPSESNRTLNCSIEQRDITNFMKAGRNDANIDLIYSSDGGNGQQNHDLYYLSDDYMIRALHFTMKSMSSWAVKNILECSKEFVRCIPCLKYIS